MRGFYQNDSSQILFCSLNEGELILDDADYHWYFRILYIGDL